MKKNEEKYKVKKLDNGRIVVEYCISKFRNENGEKIVLISDKTTTVEHIDFEKCIALMKDVRKHKLFTSDFNSKVLKKISDKEWIIYYFTKNPWPIKNSDYVSRMVFTENREEKIAIFELNAAPLEFETKNISRMINSTFKYIFQDLDDGRVKITLIGNSSPPVKVPIWLVKLAFPKAPANAIRKFIQLVKKY